MSAQQVPRTHHGRGRADLLAALSRDARRRSRALPQPWDPVRGAESGDTDPADAGRALLDGYALALHVLWTYQQAWAEEGFLGTATLSASVRRLLELTGYAGSPGVAASGLQHFRCRRATTLPPGFRVRADAAGDLPLALYETRRALPIHPELNELRAFVTTTTSDTDTTGAIAHAVELLAPEVQVPLPGTAAGDARALADALIERFAAARAGAVVQRNATRAKQQSLALADVVAQLRDAGMAQLCPEVFEELCHQLCHTQHLANEAGYDPVPGPLSESQELLLTMLRGMSARTPQALGALAGALARQPGETDAAWSSRLDGAAAFLDALVVELLQQARDQVVRLHGSDALERLDAEAAAADPFVVPGALAPRGVAEAGTDSVYLESVGTEAGPLDPATLLRPGDWLVFGDEAEDGTRSYTEAVRVVRLRTETPDGRRGPSTRLTFAPPLGRRYPLDRTVLLGNVTEIAHGATLRQETVWHGGSVLELDSGPLTWLRSTEPAAVDGREPAVGLAVAGRDWRRVPDLRGHDGDAAFAVEVTAEGTSRLRLAGSEAAVPDGATLTVTYRAGVGSAANRPAGAIAATASAEHAVLATFNPLPVSGGADAEDAATSRRRAHDGVHALQRAVSPADLRSLAASFPGVRQAAVRRDPVRRRDHVTVIVGGEHGVPLAEADLVALRAFLLARTPPGTTVTPVNAAVVPIRMRIGLRVAAGADPLAALAAARVRLGVDTAAGEPPGLLHPEVTALGQAVHLSDVYGALAGLSHVDSVLVHALHRADTRPARHDVVAVPATALPGWAGTDPLDLVWEESRP